MTTTPDPPRTLSDRAAAAALSVARMGWRSMWRGVHAGMLVALRSRGEKRISAMIRVKNEEEFLAAAVRSIVDTVDEVVLVDNLSSDATPKICASLRREHGDKIVCHGYEHEIRRRGHDHFELASSPDGRHSPNLSSNYYNWCLDRCTEPFILKWDGDMIATDEWREALGRWKRCPSAAVLSVRGANVHPDRRHLIAARCDDRERLAEMLTVPVAPKWMTSMSFTSYEPRLFPRLWARYGSDVWWTQTLSTPFLHRGVRRFFEQSVEVPAYVHLKFCKRDPFTDYSEDYLAMVTSNLTVGPELEPHWSEVLRRWNI